MKSKWIVFLLCLCLLTQIVMVGCSQQESVETGGASEEASVVDVAMYTDYEQHFNEPAMLQMGSEGGVLGDLETQYATVLVPEGTFDEALEIEIKNPEGVPNVQPADSTAIGSPIAVDINRDFTRLDEEVLVTMKMSPEEIEGIIHGDEIMIAYYNGVDWDYFRPKEVNLEAGTVTFGTYHFSWFWPTKPTKEKRTDDYLNKRSTADWAIKQGHSGTEDVLEKMVENMVKQSFGEVDKSLVQDIVEGIAKQDDYTKLMVSYNDYRVSGANKPEILEGIMMDQSVMIAQRMFKAVDTIDEFAYLKNTKLGKIAKYANWFSAGAKAADSAYNGKYEDMAKHFAKEAINMNPMGKFLATGAEVIDRQIKRWKSEELEAAYKVFINGADSKIPFWGYQVEAGKFDQLWDQMSGIREKIYSDAIADYYKINEIPIDASGQPTIEISDRVLDGVREEAKKKTQEMFENRRDREDEIEAIRETNEALLEAFEEARLLESTRFGYDTSKMSLEQRMAELFRLRDRIERDTGRPVGIKRGSLGEYIPVNDVASLIQLLKNKENGEKKYQELLVKLGYKEAPPADLSGAWSGKATIKTVPENMEAEICGENTTINFQDLQGKVLGLQLSLSGTDPQYNGTLTIIPPDDDGSPTPLEVRVTKVSDGHYSISAEGIAGDLKTEGIFADKLSGQVTVFMFGVDINLSKKAE